MKTQNSLRDKNKKITYDGNEMVNLLKEIEYILISLHQMGSYFYKKNVSQYEKETTQFIDNSIVCDRLAAIRCALSEKFDGTLQCRRRRCYSGRSSKSRHYGQQPLYVPGNKQQRDCRPHRKMA